MQALGVATALYAAGFIIHWIWWRVKVPRRQTATLLAIFSGTLVAGVALLLLCAADGDLGFWALRNAWEVVHVACFSVAAMLAYVVAYSALEERSPSMTILSRVADAGSRGRSREELQAMLADVSPVEIRLAAMVRDGMVRDEAGTIVLTKKGWVWANTFTTWRRLLGFRLGG